MSWTSDTAIREAVRARYASAATKAAGGAYEQARELEAEAGCCGPSGCAPATTIAESSFGARRSNDAATQRRLEAPRRSQPAVRKVMLPAAVTTRPRRFATSW